jgi:hypothetical protein
VSARMIGKVEEAAWSNLIKDYVYAYNIRLHTVTVKNLLPSLISKHDQEVDEVRIKMHMKCAVAKTRGKKNANCRKRATESSVQGDTVFVKYQAIGK